MKRPIGGNKISLKLPEWYLLAEYTLSEFLSDDEQKNEHIVGFQFHPVRELIIPPECVKRIGIILANFGKEAMEHIKTGRGKFPERIRIFCQQNMIDKEIQGGWGYFQVERSIDASICDGTKPDHFIDVYLYQEG